MSRADDLRLTKAAICESMREIRARALQLAGPKPVRRLAQKTGLAEGTVSRFLFTDTSTGLDQVLRIFDAIAGNDQVKHAWLWGGDVGAEQMRRYLKKVAA